MTGNPEFAVPGAVDLHTHSTASDGSLAPAALVARAAARGVRCLALTDHDTLGGLAEARAAARVHDIAFVPGVELSVSWENRTLHVLGLGLAHEHESLRQGLVRLGAERKRRAVAIDEGLRRAGVEHALAGAARAAGEAAITRTHFANFLVGAGHARNNREAFRRWLARGRPGYVSGRWATLEEALEWIRLSGGHAVLAHPLRYKLGRGQLRRLAGELSERGATGLEIATPGQTPADMERLASLALSFGLAGSCGSDFHGEATPHREPGSVPPLPPKVPPIWDRF